MLEITVYQGIDATFVGTLFDDSDAVFTAYTGTEPLVGTVSAGRDEPALAALVPVWNDAPAGLFNLPIPGAVSQALAAGTYHVQVRIADGSADLWEGLLTVGYSPGSATPRKVYCQLRDLVKRFPSIRGLLGGTDDPTGSEARADAREWFEDLLQRHFRGGYGLNTDFHFIPGLSFGGSYFGSELYRPGIKSQVLQGWLDADRLDVTPQVVECCAYYALALVCDQQPERKENSYSASARKFFGRAEDAAGLLTAEIDSDGDSVNDVWIKLSIADTLEA